MKKLAALLLLGYGFYRFSSKTKGGELLPNGETITNELPNGETVSNAIQKREWLINRIPARADKYVLFDESEINFMYSYIIAIDSGQRNEFLSNLNNVAALNAIRYKYNIFAA